MSDEQKIVRDEKTARFGTEGGRIRVERENGKVMVVHVTPVAGAEEISLRVERNAVGNVSYVPLDGGAALRSLEETLETPQAQDHGLDLT